MSEEITREHAIGVITMHREHWRRLLQGNVCSKAEGEESIASFDMAIAALESQVADCETCRFKDRSWDEEPCDGCCENHNGYSALSAEPMRWIPVSERLPEESGEYIVSVIDPNEDGYRHVGVAWFALAKDYYIAKSEWRELMHDEEVVAWMPLPEPYKAESEE